VYVNMLLHRSCACAQKGACKRGAQGIGGVHRSLYNKMIHVPKHTGEKLMSTPEAEETLRAVRNSAIDAGLNMVTDRLSSKRGRKSITPAGKAEFAAAAAAAPPVRRKRATAAAAAATATAGGGRAKRGATRDVFDEDDHTLEEMSEIN